MRRILKPDGYLFLGTAETTLNIDDSYKRTPMEKRRTIIFDVV